MSAHAITNGRGNPGLQDLLFTLAAQNPAACDRCLDQMKEFLRTGTLPAENAVRKSLENLALTALLDLLTPAQRELLRAATLFDLPVPVAVMEARAAGRRGERRQRLPATRPGSDGPANPGAAGSTFQVTPAVLMPPDDSPRRPEWLDR